MPRRTNRTRRPGRSVISRETLPIRSPGEKPDTKSGEGADQSTSDGPVGVAAAIAVNVSDVTAEAAVLEDLTANHPLDVHASANADAVVRADGSAVFEPSDSSNEGEDSGVSVGAAVAVNVAGVTNTAAVGGNATIDAKGLSVTADMASGSAKRRQPTRSRPKPPPARARGTWVSPDPSRSTWSGRRRARRSSTEARTGSPTPGH